MRKLRHNEFKWSVQGHAIHWLPGFPGSSDRKGSAYNAGDPDSNPWVGTIPWRREWQLTPVVLPGEFHGQGSLAGYSPWGRQESGMIERLTLSLAQRYWVCGTSMFSIFPTLTQGLMLSHVLCFTFFFCTVMYLNDWSITVAQRGTLSFFVAV